MESNSTAFLIKIKLRHSLGRPSRSDFVQSVFEEGYDGMIYCAIILSILFLLSGIMSSSVLLIIASVLFAPSHIVTSYRNAK